MGYLPNLGVDALNVYKIDLLIVESRFLIFKFDNNKQGIGQSNLNKFKNKTIYSKHPGKYMFFQVFELITFQH
jgi:hypothetical protein